MGEATQLTVWIANESDQSIYNRLLQAAQRRRLRLFRRHGYAGCAF